MNGRRVYNTDLLQPGDYGKHPHDGSWYACTPNDHLANLSRHQVVEHDDGTVSVSPSILVSDSNGPVWHGYIERGVWREVP